MFTRLWLVLAQTSAFPEVGPVPAPKTPLKFSDLRSGLRQVQDNGTTDHTFLYGFLIVLAVALCIALLARAWECWGLGEFFNQLVETFCCPFRGALDHEHQPSFVCRREEQSPPKNFSVMCPNLKCRSILIVPQEARGANVRCIVCKRLVKIPTPARAALQRNTLQSKTLALLHGPVKSLGKHLRLRRRN